MVVIIDNYDSFSYNLEQLAGQIKTDVIVKRVDKISAYGIRLMKPSHIIISSGSECSQYSSLCERIVGELKGEIPILGIGMAHQAICKSFGGNIVHVKRIMHGKQSSIHIANGSKIFRGLPPSVEVARYHSFIVDKKDLPDDFQIIAEDDEGEVMAVKNRDYEVYGLQFNPESLLTPQGNLIIRNFLEIGGANYD